MKLSRVNTGLVVFIVVVNSYIVVMPFVPAITFWLQSHSMARQRLKQELLAPSAVPAGVSTPPIQNRLIIPAMLLDAPINEGSASVALRKGLWHLPGSGNPTAGGNMVIAGHRFTYTNPEGVLYNLNRVVTGDIVGVFWQNKRYLYTVHTVTIVPPTDSTIEAPSSQNQLTIYTCTPLWWPKDRLVVIADLETNS